MTGFQILISFFDSQTVKSQIQPGYEQYVYGGFRFAYFGKIKVDMWSAGFIQKNCNY